jgi:hypothetical protein
MSDRRRYLFAIAAEDRLGPTPDIEGLPAEFGPVQSIAADGLVALVSVYLGPAIEEVPQSELASRLFLHQSVIRQLMHAGRLLPVRLGTVLDDDDKVISFLHGSGELLRSTLDTHYDTVEIEVAATWEMGEVLAQIAADPEIAAARIAAPTVPPEARSEAMIAVGKMVEAKLHERRAALTRNVLERLTPYAVDVQLTAMVSEELVCNIALLVDGDQTAEIDKSLNQLDVELDGRYDFTRIGPLPPYSFATVHVHRIEPEEIDKALVVLELDDHFDKTSILEQYRVLALTHHPDVRTAKPHAVKDFEELNWARSTLLALGRNHPNISTVPLSAVLYATVERSTGEDRHVE